MGLDIRIMESDRPLPGAVDFDHTDGKHFDIEFDKLTDVRGKEVCYWRAHWGLYWWLASLYYRKGGQKEGDDWNGEPVQLDRQDLMLLDKHLKWDIIPRRAHDRQFAHTIKQDRKLVRKAIRKIDQGHQLYCYASH